MRKSFAVGQRNNKFGFGHIYDDNYCKSHSSNNDNQNSEK